MAPPRVPDGAIVRQEDPSTASSKVRTLFEGLFSRYRKVSRDRKHWGPREIPRFEMEINSGMRETRLFCLAYPDEAEELASQTIRTAASEDDFVYGLYLLRYLAADARRESALNLLGSLADQPNSPRSRLALWSLGKADFNTRFRELYLKKCQEGVVEAFEPLSFRPDAGAIQALDQFLAAHEHDTSSIPSGLALQAREHLALLQDPDTSKLAGLLGARADDTETLWALRAAVQLPLPDLLLRIRSRLDDAYSRAAKPENIPPENVGGMTRYDVRFDDYLVAYAHLGGKLSPWELAHLRSFGYACDARERLSEILAQ